MIFRYKRGLPMFLLLWMLCTLTFANQSFAGSQPTLSSLLSDDSWQQFQELTPAVQSVIRDSMLPQVLKKVPAESQQAAMESITRVTHEQNSGGGIFAGRGGWMYGVDLALGSTIGWTANTTQKDWMHVDMEFETPYSWRDVDSCSNCYSAIAWLPKPAGPGYYNLTGKHQGQYPVWGRLSFDTGWVE